MIQNPLFRWTIGPVNDVGFEILEHSVHVFKSFRNDFDLLICHNQLNEIHLTKLKKMNVPLFCQDDYQHKLLFPPKGCGWKLYPPRLRPNTHEVIMDNDLVLFNDSFLKRFLGENKLLITEAQGRRLGHFDRYSLPEVKMNSGLIGLPPGFDFEAEILNLQRQSGMSCFEDFFDEQGLVAAIVSNHDHIQIGMDEIHVCIEDLIMTPTGLHFVRANQGLDAQWIKYRKQRVTKML